MASPLGPGTGSAVRIPVYNNAAVTLSKGIALSLDKTSTYTMLSDSIDEFVLPVQLYAGTAGTTGMYIGCASEDIPAGQFGEAIILGMARVLLVAAVVKGAAISPIDASGKYDDAGTSTAGEVGVALEVGAADTLGWAYIGPLADSSLGAV